MHIYEYLFAAAIIMIMLIASSAMVETFSEPLLETSEKEQLKVAAQKLMTQILLNPGDPPEWGNNVDINAANLKSFGLAKYGETTREAYVLDPDKVLRLTLPSNHALHIPPSRVVELLNLGHDYGFAIEFHPVLTVNVDTVSNEVTVFSEKDGLPLWYAKVYAKMYYYDENSGRIMSTPQINTVTGTDGKCALNFGVVSEKRVLILVVNYYGIRIIQVVNTSGSNVEKAYLLGGLLYADCEVSGNAIEVMVNKKELNYVIESVAYTPDGYLEPSAIAVLAVSKDNSSLIYASRLPIPETSEELGLIYSSIGDIRSFPFAYSVERSAIISGSVYIVRLYLWRMAF